MRLPDADIMVICVNETKENISRALKYKFSGKLMEMREIMEMASLPRW